MSPPTATATGTGAATLREELHRLYSLRPTLDTFAEEAIRLIVSESGVSAAAIFTYVQRKDQLNALTSYGLDELAERALYYVDGETLYEWSELAEEALDWEVCKLSPLCVTIADPPELPDGEEIREAIDISPAGTVLRELTGQSAKDVSGEDEESEDEGPRALCNDDGTTCAVQVMMAGTPGDLTVLASLKNGLIGIIGIGFRKKGSQLA